MSFSFLLNSTGNNRSGSMNVGARVAAGITTGGLAVFFAQPTDVVKVRFQASINGGSSAPRYASTLQAYKAIAAKEGMRGLWKGKSIKVLLSMKHSMSHNNTFLNQSCYFVDDVIM